MFLAGLPPLFPELWDMVLCVELEPESGPEAGLRLDFAAMPELRNLGLCSSGPLHGGSSLAAARHLSCLRFFSPTAELAGDPVTTAQLEVPWVLEALRALPASVIGLGLCGEFGNRGPRGYGAAFGGAANGPPLSLQACRN